MKKKVLIGVVIGVIVLVIAIGLFFVLKGKGMSEKDILANPEKALEFCASSPDDKKDGCYLYTADILGKNDTLLAVPACMNLSGEGDRKNCIDMLVAEENEAIKAIEVCNAFASDRNFREHCYGAVSSKNELDIDAQLLMCEKKTGSDQGGCYMNIANQFWQTNVSKALEICQKITTGSERDNCLNYFINIPELVKANPELAASTCDLLTFKSRCYNDVARAISASDPKQAAEICKKAGDDTQISDCYNNAWFYSNDLTINNYDFTVSMCNVLTVKKDDCLNRIVGIFIDINRDKAAAVCKLMSASASSSCLQSVQR